MVCLIGFNFKLILSSVEISEEFHLCIIYLIWRYTARKYYVLGTFRSGVLFELMAWSMEHIKKLVSLSEIQKQTQRWKIGMKRKHRIHVISLRCP